MNQKIYDHVEVYNKDKNWGITEKDIIETIKEGKEVFQESEGHRRHWEDVFKVVEVNGMLIGFMDATTTGDLNAEEKGWEFDPSTICEVESYEVTETKYREKTK